MCDRRGGYGFGFARAPADLLMADGFFFGAKRKFFAIGHPERYAALQKQNLQEQNPTGTMHAHHPHALSNYKIKTKQP